MLAVVAVNFGQCILQKLCREPVRTGIYLFDCSLLFGCILFFDNGSDNLIILCAANQSSITGWMVKFCCNHCYFCIFGPMLIKRLSKHPVIDKWRVCIEYHNIAVDIFLNKFFCHHNGMAGTFAFRLQNCNTAFWQNCLNLLGTFSHYNAYFFYSRFAAPVGDPANHRFKQYFTHCFWMF